MGALKDMIADGVALPSPMRFKATPTSARHGSRSPIPVRKSMQTRQSQTQTPLPGRPGLLALNSVIGRNRRQAMSDACAVVSRGESKSVPRWCHHGPLRLTAALVALAMLAFAAPASAGTDIWRATIVVKDNPNEA